MEKILSIEERVVLIVEEFFKDIKDKEPFAFYLEDYRFKLRSKLIELLSQFTDSRSANVSFDRAMEGMLAYLEKRLDSIDFENETELRRFLEAVEKTNELLKEFLEGDRIKDKSVLSKVSGRLGLLAEELRMEINRRFGGLLRRIKRLFGR
ncbi:hypothetical protein [Thermocrinis sp.]|uniref:hypothetical protein n=1 Tax=Thermocrinis sp. TaxID=2024383 RepID=UPI002FDD9EEF